MTNLLTVEMDCNPDASADTIRSDADKFNIIATLVNPEGPGGGCPIFSFVGTKSDLRAFLKAHHNPGLDGTDLEEEVNYYLSLATPV
jgi:hypothetical protein